MKIRCEWVPTDPLYINYHDNEWGVPEHEDRKLFELLILEGAQAGLSWLTILRKHDSYRKAFDDFDTEKIAEYDEGKVEELLKPVSELAGRLARDLNLELPEIKESEIDRSPEANLYFMRGLGYYYGNMPDHAIAEFMKALALKPDHARARYWNSVCYFDDTEYEHAKIELDRFLKKFPKHEFAPKIEEMLEICASEIQERESARDAE